MPTGVIINALSVVFGGLLGGLVGNKLSEDFKTQINMIFGVCSMGMGISSIGLMKYMPAVIFAIVIGTGIGLALHLGDWINKGGALMQRSMAKIVPNDHSSLSHEDYLATLLTVIVLFCASGTGIYGSLDAGMTGDSTILISKSILDFFTAAIFACNLGYVVSLVAIPQFIIFCCLFFLSAFIVPLTTPDMIADFKACGGFLMLATGFRMVKLKMFPIADMIPAMILVMPLSWFWVNVILPLL
ncbi:hypothetical protein BA718_08300 [Streptococcus gallolyticus subsp. gallolyticus]|uniref:DUF554 domain-containing protein n=2 Tax=Streptococcus gallolyticus TaxID=315405 RepID=A0A139R4Z5_9STRE|nr:DUF554 domain-containing protein [Streptococcus gallolyticus]AQP42789.1 putative membrane protein [Streptococcus gallolyticus subsp. gallolyticus DSM 16831]KJE99350.1 membrane protein [Streptococcus gallolyticus subsp. gallolyticus]KXT72392.1 putative inner membrane protein [Streptococcus gallolyticus]KXU09879.1 putative inner membrane protein [Streptococcus gallolyticus]MBE6164626.1 DUF554 domain-containing protein [Streptococcus gallolyticus]